MNEDIKMYVTVQTMAKYDVSNQFTVFVNLPIT